MCKDNAQTIKKDNTKTIVTCGHSLGAAISQLIHMNLDIVLKMESQFNLINITFAPPMVGNLHLRNSFNLPYAKNLTDHMYHFEATSI